MQALVREWPHPIERFSMLGHSMGGLVARSACHYGELANHTWVARLDRLVFLGSPHFGSPLERAGTRADFLIEASPYTAPFARLGKVRSAGVRDLGHGYLRDEDWQRPPGTRHAGHAALPLPPGVRCHAMAASRQQRPGKAGARLRGDGLVPVDSALGRSRDAARDLGLPDAATLDRVRDGTLRPAPARGRVRAHSQLARRRSRGRVARATGARLDAADRTGGDRRLDKQDNSSKRLIAVV